MIKEQVDRYNMLLRVQYHFDSNPGIWSSNIPVSDIKIAFSAKLEEIYKAEMVQSTDSTGATVSKTRLRDDLEAKGFFVSSVLSSYTNINPSPDPLFKRLQITRSRFTKFRENDLLIAIDDLDGAATAIVESLSPFGVTQAILDELMAARTAFYNIMNHPKEVMVNRKNATALIGQLLREAVLLLENQMDHQMVVFKGTEREFFDVYFLDRAIHRTGKRKLSLSITTLDAATNTPLAMAEIEVVDHGIKRISNKSGLNKVQNQKEGHYTLSVSHPDFISQTIPFIIINGQTTEIVAKLRKEGSKLQRDKVAKEVAEETQ